MITCFGLLTFMKRITKQPNDNFLYLQKHYTMGKYSFEEIRFIKHLWQLNYNELGLAKGLSKILSRNYLLILVTTISWLLMMPKVTDSTIIIILPFLLVGLSFFLIFADGVYSSLKVLNILELCRKYVDENMTLDELFSVMKSPNEFI